MQIKFNLDLKERLAVWEFPDPAASYVIGGDTSEGIEGGDASSLQILKRRPLVQVATWWGYVEGYEFGRISRLIAYWYNTAILAIERNSNGIVALDHLRAVAYPNLYKMQKFDFETMDYTERIGWITTSHTRDLWKDSLRDDVREGAMIINDPDTLAEMKTFVRSKRSGKVQASPGNRDDRVVALGIASYVNRITPLSFSQGVGKKELYIERIRKQEQMNVPITLGRYDY